MHARLTWDDVSLREPLGSGQAAEVWRGVLRRSYRTWEAGEAIAVKRYKRWVLQEPGQFERIHRELVASIQVDHPAVVKSLGLIADPDGLPCLVMQLYDGITLERHLTIARGQRRLIPIPEAFSVVGSLCSAVAALHGKRIVHRDIKPANIILTPNGPVLMDLGVVSSCNMAEQTTSQSFLGTIRYSSPAYLFGGPSNAVGIDIYSLAAIAFELFIGRRFYNEAEHWAQLIFAIGRGNTQISHKDYRRLELRGGIHAAEAARCLLKVVNTQDSSDFKVSLNAYASAIESRFWEEPFFIRAKRILHGEPLVEPLAFQKLPHNVPLKEVYDALSKTLTRGEFNWLARTVRATYWLGTRVVNNKEKSYDWWMRMASLGIIEYDDTPSFTDFWRFVPTVTQLYRFGYFPQAKRAVIRCPQKPHLEILFGPHVVDGGAKWEHATESTHREGATRFVHTSDDER